MRAGQECEGRCRVVRAGWRRVLRMKRVEWDISVSGGCSNIWHIVAPSTKTADLLTPVSPTQVPHQASP